MVSIRVKGHIPRELVNEFLQRFEKLQVQPKAALFLSLVAGDGMLSVTLHCERRQVPAFQSLMNLMGVETKPLTEWKNAIRKVVDHHCRTEGAEVSRVWRISPHSVDAVYILEIDESMPDSGDNTFSPVTLSCPEEIGSWIPFYLSIVPSSQLLRICKTPVESLSEIDRVYLDSLSQGNAELIYQTGE